MKSFACLTLAAVASAATMSNSDYEFMRFIVVHGKQYKNTAEYSLRKSIYLGKTFAFEQLNEELTTSTVGHNFLSDLTNEEIKSMLGFKQELRKNSLKFKIFEESSNSDGVNWVTAGAVTPVKN